jgi:hypothetical protein
VKDEHLKKAVALARKQQDCHAILIVFDSDDDCPRSMKDSIELIAQSESGLLPCRTVLPHREYEAWFLASMESLRGRRGIRDDATSPQHPESIRDAKGALERQMRQGQSYMETVDQTALSELFDMKQAFIKCRSFRRMVTVFGELLQSMGITLDSWPPREWLQAD